MARLRDKGYTCVLFAVIDIIKERTTILAVGHEEAVAETFGAALEENHVIRLPGILSRKKHIVPLLGNLARRISPDEG
jgi:manganese-dependent inorganic pyrophosphatase